MPSYKIAVKLQQGPAKLVGSTAGGTLTLLPDGRALIEATTATRIEPNGKRTNYTFAAGKLDETGTWQLSGDTLSCSFDGSLGTMTLAAKVTMARLTGLKLSGRGNMALLGAREAVATGSGRLIDGGTVQPPKPIGLNITRAAYAPAGGQMFSDGHICRNWDDPTIDIDAVLNGVAKNGFTGFRIELCGRVPSFGGNVNVGGQAYTAAGGIFKYHVKQAQSARFRAWYDGCRARNLWFEVFDYNTNDKALKGKTNFAEFASVHQAILAAIGTVGVIRIPMNENDENCDATMRERYEDLVAASMPDNQTVSTFEREGWAVYTEFHPSKIAKIRSYPRGPKTWVTLDNGTVIDETTIGSTLGGDGKADIPKHVEAAKEARAIGASFCNYSFLTDQDPALQDALGKVVGVQGEPSPVPTTGPRIVSLKASSREFYIDFVLAGVDHWKNNADRLSAEIIINGVYVENIREGYTSQHLKNVYGTGSYAVRGLKTGQPCEIWFRKKGSNERTQSVLFVWPWEGT